MTLRRPLQKPMYLLKRRSTLSRKQFADHWFDVHAALLRSIPEWPELRSGYVQNHLIEPDPISERPFPYDGVAQVYVRPGTEGRATFPEMQVFRERVIPDEEAFLDRERTIVLKTLEHVVLPGQSAVKVIVFHRRRAGTSISEFTDRWSNEHKSLVLDQNDFVKALSGYRQNHLITGASRYLAGEVVPAREDFDGVSEFWFDSPETAKVAFNASGYKARVRDHASDLFDVDREITCLVDPRMLLAE